MSDYPSDCRQNAQGLAGVTRSKKSALNTAYEQENSVAKTCENCEFWEYDEKLTKTYTEIAPERLGWGFCRKNAPRILYGSGTGWSDKKWPEQKYNEWCGEHKEREKK